jgi:hypothetical protein
MKKTAGGFAGLVVLFGLCAVGNCFGQNSVADGQTTANVRDRINTIIRQTIQSGEFTTAEGVKAITRVPPSTEDVNEIKSYGDRAVQPLAEYLATDNAFEYELAMRLMGALGGKRIIAPLKKVALYDPSARKREYALRWITQGPWDLASQVITEAAENDRDANVRKAAREYSAATNLSHLL